MDFIDEVRGLARRATELAPTLLTEEATKTSLVLPFIRQILGFDIFDPNQVIPEFIADVGGKKGEKIDYALLIDSKPVAIIECKAASVVLGSEHASQLFRYFATQTGIKVAILTNGIDYQFYCDLNEKNRMDESPFFEFSMAMGDVDEAKINELKRFTKTNFAQGNIAEIAWNLVYINKAKSYFSEQYEKPTEQFIRFVAGQVYQGVLSPKIRKLFEQIVKKAYQQYVNEIINSRLKRAMEQSDPIHTDTTDTTTITSKDAEQDITTTEDEYVAFSIVRAILANEIPTDRVILRDKKNICNVLLDGSSWKILCRFDFNGKENLSFFIPCEGSEEMRVLLKKVSDIYLYSEQLRERGKLLMHKSWKKQARPSKPSGTSVDSPE